MTREKLVHFICSIIPIGSEDAEHIALQFDPFVKKKGEILLQKNQISDDYMYLEEGLIRSYLYDLDGDEVTTDFYGENAVAFEVTSFFNRAPSETYMEALSDCRGFRIGYENLNKLFHEKPAFREFGRALLVREFIASKRRNYAMINQSAEQRYKNLLTQRPEILKIAPLKHIASYLGITDSTLSRIRAK